MARSLEALQRSRPMNSNERRAPWTLWALVAVALGSLLTVAATLRDIL
jgi:hypothetical protein